MKYTPLQGQPCKFYEIPTLTMDNSVNYMEIHYMKYISLQETTL